MTIGAFMAGGNSQTGRVENDVYDTPEEVTQTLFTSLPHFFPTGQMIYEPCCGDGKMGRVIEKNGYGVIGTDINPRGYGSKADFKTLTSVPYKNVVTNPPFKDAEELIRKALGEWKVERLALLLKSTYFHASERTVLFDEFKPTHILALPWRPDFHGQGRPTMEMSWFVWDFTTVDAECSYRIAHNLNPKKKSSRKPAS